MRHNLNWGAAAVAMAVVMGLGAATVIAQDKEAIVKERRAAMKEQSASLKAIKAYLDGNGDQATAVAKAKDLLMLADQLLHVWPEGTSSKDMPGKTNAKPEIWMDMAKFNAIPVTLQADDQKLLNALEKGDKPAAQAAFGDIGKNACGACHGAFREKLG